MERAPLTATSREALKVSAGEIWVTDDGAGLSSALAARIRFLGWPARLVGQGDIPKPRPSSLAGLIIVASLNADDAFLSRSFQLLQSAGPALRQAGSNGGSLLATVSRLDGAFGLGQLEPDANVLAGGLAGLAKTAAHEWPEVSCKAIDLGPTFADLDDAARALAAEVFMAGPREIGISASGSSVLHLAEIPIKAATPPFGRGDVVIVSGGARGVTAEAAVALGRATGCTLLLLGRSPEPKPEPDWLAALTAEADIKGALIAHGGRSLSPREAAQEYEMIRAGREMRQTLDRIRETGSEVIYRSIDVRDEPALRSLLGDVRSRVGPIRGLIHGAGVLADCRIEDKTVEQFESVYSTKVAGLRALLAATENDDLKAIVLFSSSTGRFGRTGQVAYAVANEVLNKIAQQQARVRRGCRVVALNWGPWDGGMVTPALKSIFESEGVGVIPLEAGGQHCVAEMAADGPVEIVVLGESLPPIGRAERRSYFDPTAVSATNGLVAVFEREVSALEMPVLRSHILGGRAVVPLALIAEWLAHAALHGCPGLAFHGFDDLRVLKGIRVADGRSAAVNVQAGKTVKQDAFYHVQVELHGIGPSGQDVLHSRATVVLANRLPAAPEPAAALPLPAYHRDKTEIYRELLFHGPELQGIERVEGCSEDGIEAKVASARGPAVWLRQPLRGVWIAEPMALDGAFQLMVVWTFENYGCGSLPTSVGRYRQFRRSFPRDGVRIRAEVKRHGPQRAVADVWFLDRAGVVVARMDDYECVIDASLNQAFRRNQLLAENPRPAGMELEPAAEAR